jgi:uncharacterized membrane protein YebE (DUF533 family)
MKSAIIIAVASFFAIETMAQPPRKKDDKNPYENTLLEARRNHKQRIQEGIKSGELTKGEAKTLTDMEDKIKQAMYKAKQSGGVIDATERDNIQAMLHELSNKIEELKSNADKRSGK